MTWMIWDNETQEMMTNVEVNYSLGSENFYCNDLLLVSSIDAASTIIQQIPLPGGWFIFSTYVAPENPNMSSIFSGIVDNVTIVKDYLGSVYWPSVGINSIGNITQGQGYYVKTAAEDTLMIEGQQIDSDYPINMPSGWSITGYLHTQQANAVDMMAPMVSDMTIMKDYLGNVYWPAVGINSIGNLTPGYGYYIKTTAAGVFSYPDMINGRFMFGDDAFVSMNYESPINTGNNMTLGIPSDIWQNEPILGDEIAVYDQNDMLVGVGPYKAEFSAITIWGDDELTNEKDGLYNGEKFVLKLWRHNQNIEENIIIEDWKEGSGAYFVNSISIASSINQETIQEKQLIHITDILGREIDSDSKKSVLLLSLIHISEPTRPY